MKLGEVVQITLSTDRIRDSLPFYQTLGFQVVERSQTDPPWVLLTDGVILLLLGEDPSPFQGLTYFAADMQARIDAMEAQGMVFADKGHGPDIPYRAAFFDPNGFRVNLVQYAPGQIFQPDGQSFAKCGTFGELSIPTTNLEETAAFWEQFGFSRAAGVITEPYPWAILSDGLITLGIHQTRRFHERMLTYFDPAMGARLTELRAAGIEFEWEEQDPEGRTIYALAISPEGQGFFFFQE
jgi:catechol 2,3-dioxygenase-like lactoylglutathione lyase family enzyme